MRPLRALLTVAAMAVLAGVAYGGPKAEPAGARMTRPAAKLLASLSAWLLHALLDDFERFWPTSVAFWLLAGLSLSRASPAHGASD